MFFLPLVMFFLLPTFDMGWAACLRHPCLAAVLHRPCQSHHVRWYMLPTPAILLTPHPPTLLFSPTMTSTLAPFGIMDHQPLPSSTNRCGIIPGFGSFPNEALPRCGACFRLGVELRKSIDANCKFRQLANSKPEIC